jgi:RimJ/RimL family protein N-acetyltransferase
MAVIQLGERDKPAIFEHLARLNSNDRYLRFFAVVNDSILHEYVNSGIDLSKDRCFGVYSGKALVAFAHLSPIKGEKSAELGISVDENFRRGGLARKLLDRVINYCHVNKLKMLFMSCLRQNGAIQRLATAAGLKVINDHDEAIAELKLSDSPFSQAISLQHELIYEQIAIMDKCYRRNNEMIELLFNRR